MADGPGIGATCTILMSKQRLVEKVPVRFRTMLGLICTCATIAEFREEKPRWSGDQERGCFLS